ncbi:MAG: hypothetical protein R3C61_29415 [Bacteroidia bacterium]
MELLKLNEQQYGWVFAIIAAGLITATQLNNQWLKKLQSEQIILVSLAAQAVMGILLLVTTLWGGAGVVGYTLLIFGFLFFMGFIFPNASALTLAPMGHVAGSASALMGGIQMCVGASASALVGFLQGETPVPMASVMAVCALGSLALFYFGRRLWHLHR